MEQNTDADVAVVEIDYQEEAAYNMGHAEFADHDTAEDPEVDPYLITDSARYANVIAPELRAMAGYADRGMGTYTDDRQVAAIVPGCEEDVGVQLADLTDASALFDELHSAFFRGAHDALDAE
jgi:hypothetical protein